MEIWGQHQHGRNNSRDGTWVFGRICPNYRNTPSKDARKEFPGSVKPGDFVVAGKNFGMGSSREHAPIVIKTCGVAAVLAQSFARIFYRNAINIGLPAIVCDTTIIDEGDQLELHLTDGVVENLTRKTKIQFPAMSKTMETILSEGGLIAYVEKHGDLVFS